MKVNYDELARVLEFQNEINRLKLTEIEWVRDSGDAVEVDPRLLDYFHFLGLCNTSFAELFLSEIVAGRQDAIMKDVTGFEQMWGKKTRDG